MAEIINKITEFWEMYGHHDDNGQTRGPWNYGARDGWIIETSEQRIYVTIGAHDDCCASHGQICSEDDVSPFFGAELIKIEIVNTALNSVEWDKKTGSLDAGDAMFVNFETSKGTFQLSVYNSHNGYYGNAACVISKQLNVETYI